MKRKRITALILTAFMVLNESVYPVNQYVTYAQSEDELQMEEAGEGDFSDEEVRVEQESEESETADDLSEGILDVFDDGNEAGHAEEISGVGANETDIGDSGEISSEEPEFVISDAGVLTEYKGSGGAVVIPDNVTEIGAKVFNNNQTITAVEFPDGLTKIGAYAFSGCSSLTGELKLPEKLETIGNYAFDGCLSLSGDLTIPDSVTSIGEGAFQNCSGFDGSLKLSENLEAIESYSFYGCSGITGELEIPGKVKKIKSRVFGEMKKITGVTIGEGVGSIYTDGSWSNAFYNLTGVETVRFLCTVPPSVSYSSYGIFYYMSSLKTIYIPQGTYQAYGSAYGSGIRAGVTLKEEGSGDFIITDGELVSYTGTDTEVEIPDNVTSIGLGAFRNNTVLQKVTIPSGVTSIGNYAFANCTALQEAAYRENSKLERIGESAFSGCTSLERTELSQGLKTLGGSAFNNCNKLNMSMELPSELAKIGNNTFSGCSSLTGELKLPEKLETIGNYAFDGCSGLSGDLTIPDSVTSIGEGAFQNCSGFDGSLKLSENLEAIESYSFYGCSGITGELEIPGKVKRIKSRVFGEMKKITGVTIGEGVGSIYTDGSWSNAFYNLTGVETVRFLCTVPPSVSYSSYGIFYYMSSLKTIYIPQGTYQAYSSAYGSGIRAGVTLKEEGSEDFIITDGELVSYTGTDTEVVVPDNVTSIGLGAFRNNTVLQKVTIPSGVTSIGNYVFANCTALQEAVYGEDSKLESIGESAFSGCTSLERTELASGLKELGAYAFNGCSKLVMNMELPAGLAKIGNNTFNGCSSLTGELKLPEKMETIGNYAFSGCSGLSGDLTIPDSVTSIGEGAFKSCSGFDGSLKLSENLTTIEIYSFYECSGITGELEIPGKVKKINSRAFGEIKKITGVTIGEAVNYIYTDSGSMHAFYNLTGVETVRFLGTVPPTQANSYYGIFYYMSSLKKIYVPEESLEAYQKAYGSRLSGSVEWSTDASELPPANLQAEHVYSHTVHLSWKALQSENFEGYQVYRDGTEEGNLLTETPIKDAFYTDKNLETGESHTYYVRTCLMDDRYSGFAQVTAATALPVVNKIYTDNRYNKIGITKNRIYADVADTGNLKAMDAKETRGVFYYLNSNGRKVQIGEGALTAGKSKGTGRYEVSWNLDDLESGSYTVVFVLTDADGETAQSQETIQIDRSRPQQIVGVMAIGDVDQITLTWGIAAELDTTGYRVYRKAETDEGFRIIGYITKRDILSYTDKTVKSGHAYQYYITGINEFKVESLPSETVTASPVSDTEKPRIIKMYPANSSRINGAVSFGAQSEDNVGIRETRLYISTDNVNWTKIGSARADFASASYDTSDISSGTLWLKGAATDTNGNESESFVYQYQVDNEGPSAVRILKEKCVTTSVTAALAWENVPEEDVGSFRVEQFADGKWTSVGDVSSTLGMNIYGLIPDTDYTYRVIAYDQLGNRGKEPDSGVTLHTQADSMAPVITSLNPKPGTYSDRITLSATAKDDYGIRKIQFQISEDNQNWKTVEEKNYETGRTSVTAEYVLSVKEYSDGFIYYRAVAEDFSGQQSDTGETAPFVQYSVDHTAPEQPVLISCEGRNGYIEICWKQGKEEDLAGYKVYRSEENGEYSKIAENLYQVNYIDRNVKEGTGYKYKICVSDTAGNISTFSEEMQEPVSVLADTEKPEIVSVYPESGSSVSDSYGTVRVLAQDNRELSSVRIMWKEKEETEYRKLIEKQNVNSWNTTIETGLPVKQLEDGDIIDILVLAEDRSGNISEPYYTQYTVDLTAPKINGVKAAYTGEKVVVFWNGELPADLIGYRIYKRDNRSTSWNLIAQRQVVSGQKNYSIDDWNLPLGRTELEYKVEAVDEVGNISSKVIDKPVVLPDRSSPKAVLNCESVMEQGVEYLFDASMSEDDTGIISYEINFGDGNSSHEVKAGHKYEETGTYHVRLTVVDGDGNKAVAEKNITVRERVQLGTLEVTVKDSDGRAVSGAEVYFDLGSEKQFKRFTDGSGRASFTAETGTHAVGCIKGNNEYLPVKKEVVITANNTTSITMILVQQPIVEGKFEVKRMTFDEIKAAGLDISSPENQYLVTVNVTLVYGSEVIKDNIMYNPSTGWSDKKPIIVDTSSGKHMLIPNIIWSGSNTGGSGSGTGSGSESGGGDKEIKNVSVAYLDVPIGVSALKEFFDVKLHIINNASSEFSMLNNEITLNVPAGLSVVESSAGTEKNVHVSVDEIKGQTTKTIEWILRGDEIGEYYLSADYSGLLSEFNRPVTARFEAEEPIKVYGLSGMKLTVHVGENLFNGYFFYDADLENKAGTERYLPSINITGELTEVQYYKNGSDRAEEISPDSLEVMGIGDKLVYHYKDYADNKLPENASLKNKFAALKEVIYSIQQTYGLEVEIVTEDIGYFEDARETATFEFDSRGGTPVEPIKDIVKGMTVTVPKAPVKEGKYFQGWFENPDGTGEQLTHKTKARKTMIWYALWGDEPVDTSTLFSKLNGKEYGVHVTDNSGNPIDGAKVTREDRRGEITVTTDKDGDAVFDDFAVGTVAISITKEGYLEYYNGDYEITEAGYDTFVLYKTSQEGHIVTKAMYSAGASETDLLKGAKRLSNDFSFSFKIRCETANGNQSGEHLELWQNTNKIADADSNGVFQNLRAASFVVGKGIHIRNYYSSDNPYLYTRTLLNMEIMKSPKVYGTLSLGSETGFSIDSDVPFLGGMKISTGLPPFPVDLKIDQETETVQLAINVKKETFNTEKRREECKKWLSSVNQARQCGSMDSQELTNKFSEYCREHGRMSLSGWDVKAPEVSVLGYAEGKLSSGNWTKITGYLCLQVKASAKYGWTIPSVFSIPIVVEIKVSADGKLSAKVTYDLEKNNLSGTLGFDFSISLDALVGVGISGITAGGVTGNATLDLEFYLANTNGDKGLNSATLTGSMGVKAYLGPVELTKQFAQKKYYLYTRNNERESQSSAGSAAKLLYDANAYTTVDRTYLEKQSDWKGSEESSEVIKPLLTDTYGGSDPQIVSANGKIVMVFRYDNEDRDVWNMGQLMYSVLKDGKWQEPQPVDDNELADISFDLNSDGNEITLSYQEANEKLTENTAAINKLTAHTSVRFMKFDLSSMIFTEAEQVSENSDTYAFRARTFTVNGEEIMVWIGNPKSDIFTLNSENQILYRIRRNGRWGEVKTLVKDSNYIPSFCVGILEGKTVLVYAADGDNDPGTTSDRTVYGIELNGNVLFREEGGCEEITYLNLPDEYMNGFVWNQDGVLMYRNSVKEKSMAVTGQTDSVSSNFKICGKNIYYIATDENGFQNIFCMKKTAENWASPVQITDQKEQIISFDVCSFGDGDYITLMRSNGDFENESNTMSWLKVGETHDLALAGTSFEMEDAIPGKKLPVALRISNQGSEAVSEIGYSVETVSDEQLPEIICQGTKEMNLLSGTETQTEIEIPIPEDASSGKLKVRIWELKDGKTVEELKEDNNSAEIQAAFTDLSVSAKLYTTAGNNIAVITVRNNSQIAAGGELKVYDTGRVDGIIIQDEKIQKLKPGEEQTYRLELGNDIFTDDTTELELAAEVVSDVADYAEQNNCDTVIVQKMVHARFYAEGVLLADDLYQAGESLILPADPEGDGIFRGWYTDGKLAEDGSILNDDTEYYAVFHKDIEKADVSATDTLCITGKELMPEPTVTYNGQKLQKNTDYTVSWKNNVKTGNGEIIIKGIGGYYGERIVQFRITGHSWEKSWKVLQEATALAKGKQQRSCTRCGLKQMRSIEKLKPTLSVNADSIVLKVKQSTTKLKVTGLAKGDSIASWKSSNTRIVTVNSSGKIKAGKKTGKAKITVTLKSGLTQRISVKVQKKTVRTTKILGIQKKLSLKKGKSMKLVPELFPITSLEKVTFSSSNKKVVSVSSNGKITAKKKGTATVMIKSGKIKVKCKITVK